MHDCGPCIDRRQCLLHTGLVTSSTKLPLALVRDGRAASSDAVCCTPLRRAVLEPQEAEQLAGLLKAVAEPTRLRLLSLVAAHEGGEACVCDLTEPVGLSQPTVSHHLKILVDAGLLTREKRGVWAYSRLVAERLDDLTRALGGDR
jgi:ArsR family transcriptional regulator